jgi:hypothetical protein
MRKAINKTNIEGKEDDFCGKIYEIAKPEIV